MELNLKIIWIMIKLKNIFDIEYGDRNYADKSVLDKGKTLLIASQGVDNGAYGFFDIPKKYNPPIISVPRTGSIGYAFVQLTECNITDDCMVMSPKSEMKIEYLFYVSSMIRLKKWRFNYARKITPERLGEVEVLTPNEFKTKLSFRDLAKKLIPKKQKVKNIEYKQNKKEFILSDLFIIKSGEYHSVNNLQKGEIPLISCSDLDNGISGFYKIPNNNIHKDEITIAYDGKPLTAKYHNYKFSAYDNVGILTPKNNMKKQRFFLLLFY